MSQQQFPRNDKEEPVIHHPEFVILESTEEESQYSEPSGRQESYFDAVHRLESRHFPLFIRFMLLILSLVITIAALFYAATACIAWAVSSLTLFRNPAIVDQWKKTWKTCKKLMVISLGLFVGVFSPPFGLSLILLYFVLHGENINQGFMGRVFKTGIHPEN